MSVTVRIENPATQPDRTVPGLAAVTTVEVTADILVMRERLASALETMAAEVRDGKIDRVLVTV